MPKESFHENAPQSSGELQSIQVIKLRRSLKTLPVVWPKINASTGEINRPIERLFAHRLRLLAPKNLSSEQREGFYDLRSQRKAYVYWQAGKGNEATLWEGIKGSEKSQSYQIPTTEMIGLNREKRQKIYDFFIRRQSRWYLGIYSEQTGNPSKKIDIPPVVQKKRQQRFSRFNLFSKKSR